MKNLLTLLILIPLTGVCQIDSARIAQQERNKEIARKFYEDLWFTNNTVKYSDYVAETYVVHDIFDRKNVTEPAEEQKAVADLFWSNGNMDCTFDYQVAEGDLVATRWTVNYQPETILGNVMMGSGPINIINVFRFNEEGKIVEIWNHRHDIETNMTMRFTLKGLLIGLLIALIPTVLVFRQRKKIKRMQAGV